MTMNINIITPKGRNIAIKESIAEVLPDLPLSEACMGKLGASSILASILAKTVGSKLSNPACFNLVSLAS